MNTNNTQPVMGHGEFAMVSMNHMQAYQTQNYVNVTYDPIAWEHCRRLEAENNHHQNLLLTQKLTLCFRQCRDIPGIAGFHISRLPQQGTERPDLRPLLLSPVSGENH